MTYIYVSFYIHFIVEKKQLHVALVDSSWCGVLAALSLLLDARYSQYNVQ